MRFAVLAAVCISMVVCVTANDIAVGERQEGDVLVSSRRLLRPAVPGKPMVAQTGFNGDGEITSVTAVNAPGSDATVTIVKGGPGESSVVVTAISKLGKGMDVQVEIFATVPPPPTQPNGPASR